MGLIPERSARVGRCSDRGFRMRTSGGTDGTGRYANPDVHESEALVQPTRTTQRFSGRRKQRREAEGRLRSAASRESVSTGGFRGVLRYRWRRRHLESPRRLGSGVVRSFAPRTVRADLRGGFTASAIRGRLSRPRAAREQSSLGALLRSLRSLRSGAYIARLPRDGGPLSVPPDGSIDPGPDTIPG